MKTFSKILLILIFIMWTTESFTQNFGIRAGLNLSNLLVKDNDERYSDDFKIKPGFHVGATVEFPINEMFGIETGIIASTKGFKLNEEDVGYNGSWTLYYIDIPINGKVYYDAGGVKIYGAFGPYLGIGIYGAAKVTYMDETEKEDIKWGNDDEEDDLKRFDMGLSFGAGVEVKSFVFGISYNLGLLNISPYVEDGAKIKNRVLGISVGIKFGDK